MVKTEKKWQKRWKDARLFEADYDKTREKYFLNIPFPYVNGSPHLGHGYTLLKGEVMARYQRMLGKNVLFPFAFHATGEPIAGMAKRVAAGDESQKRALIISGVPEKDIHLFSDSKHIIDFFIGQWMNVTKLLGMAIDWRRKFVTTTLTPAFSKFVEWQYRKLKADGYVVQGSHPVIWCPNDQNPTGDHDRLEGEGVRVVDFVVLKFKSEKHDAYFLPATLRPETIFGVTNMFLKPDAQYSKVQMDGEWYIIAKDNIIKFQDQQHKIGEIIDIPIEELIGSTTINPVTGLETLILPGDFIDAQGSTGVVMSVPAHAPMDWTVLAELKANPTSLKEWNITAKQIKSIQPVSLIEVEGYGEFPAAEEIESLGITSMHDENVKQATKTIYRKEYNGGILKESTGKYAGMKVSEVKDKIIEDFQAEGIGFVLKEPADLVVCRCGTRNHVKFLENQWFLEFGDEKWKTDVKEMVAGMQFYPEEARVAIVNAIDWLENKACARRSGYGTPLPWDPEWIVETLSDSVIYMAYYIISKYVNAGQFKIEYATDETFNYILLGKGQPSTVAKKVGMDSKLLKEIRQELKYFYGFDLRTSGKDLTNNHLTFMLMHHRAIFPPEFWPKAVAINGWIKIIKPGSLQAEKMSKSKGNFKTIEGFVDAYGSDATRLGFAIAGEGLKDASFALAEAESYKKWIENIYELSEISIDDEKTQQIDKWLYHRVQGQIEKANYHLSRMETRSAFQSAYHEIMQDLKWYARRRDSKGPAYKYAIEMMIRMITPFTPHLVEEIWESWGNEGFAAEAHYPEVDESMIDESNDWVEKYLVDLNDDIRGLIRFLTEKGNPNPKKIEIFVAPEWMYEIYNDAHQNGLDSITKRAMANPENRKLGKTVANYCNGLMKIGAPPETPWTSELENIALNEGMDFLSREANAEVVIYPAGESDHPKAKAAVPRRPGINFIYE